MTRVVALLCVASGLAQAQNLASSAEAKLPVREVILRDGDPRFTIPVRVGSKTVEAGLDTGSVGLRVLSRALTQSDYQPTQTELHGGFGSGVVLLGNMANAQVSLGNVGGQMGFELVTGISCLPRQPNCPATRTSFAQYGIMGDGIPGQGFSAILGIKTNDDAKIPNPMSALGVRRWALTLPGGRLPGELQLNPNEQEAAGYVRLPVATGPNSGLHDAVHGCIVNDATQQRICGYIQIDTGAPGLSVTSAGALPTQWRPGTPVSLLFMDGGGQVHATEHLRADDRAHMSKLRFSQRPDAQYTIIHAGGSPLLCFSVLYGGDTLGFRARPTGPRLPQCSTQ